MAWLHAVIDVPADQLCPTADFWAAAFGWPTENSPAQTPHRDIG